MDARNNVVLFIIVLLLAACSVATPGAISKAPLSSLPVITPTYTQPPTPTDELAAWEWIFSAPFNPINLNVELDTSLAVEALITPEGGKLETSGADGTHYILTLPANSVAFDTLIRMTPVKTVSNLPLKQNETAWAVQLEPEGLQLLAAASLVIQFADRPPIDEQIPFQYQGEGQVFDLATPVVNAAVDTGIDATGIELDISHFSGYGVAKGFMSDLEPVRQRLGGTIERRILDQVIVLLSLERQRQVNGTADEFTVAMTLTSFEKLLDQYYQEVIKQRIEAAQTDCAAGLLVKQNITEINHALQMLGTSGVGEVVPAFQMPEGFFDLVYRNCFKEEYEMCRDQHIIHRMLPLLLSLEKERQLLGINEPIDPQILKYAQNCLTFKVEFSSTELQLVKSGEITIQEHYVVKSSIEIKLDLDSWKLEHISGSGKLEVQDFSVDITPSGFCNVTHAETTDGELSIDGLIFIHSGLQPLLVRDFSPIVDVSMPFTLSGVESIWNDECRQNGALYWASRNTWAPVFLYGFGILHRGESFPLVVAPIIPFSFKVKNWHLEGGELVATKTWERSGVDDNRSSISYAETGSFNIYHTPQ